MASDVPVPARFEAPGGPADRRAAGIRAAIVVGACVAAAVATKFLTLLPYPSCTFKLLTGMPCPGCGGTRSVARLVQGDLAASFRFHPIGPLLAAGALIVLVGALRGTFTGHDPVWRFLTRRAPQVAIGVVSLLVSLWLVRAFVVPEWGPDRLETPVSRSPR